MQVFTNIVNDKGTQVQVSSVLNARLMPVKMFTSTKMAAHARAERWINRFNRIALLANEYQN